MSSLVSKFNDLENRYAHSVIDHSMIGLFAEMIAFMGSLTSELLEIQKRLDTLESK